jgi:hypothetical protein
LLILLINSYELTFLVWGLVCLITLRQKYSWSFIQLLIPFVITVCIAVFSIQFGEIEWFKVLRDFSYLLKPLLGLIIGYNIAQLCGKKAIDLAIKGGVMLAWIHIITLIVCLFVFGIRNLNQLREHGGYFDDFETYILLFVLFPRIFNLQIDPKKRRHYLFILATSLLLYFSRTNFIQFAILYFAIKGHLSLNVQKLKWIFAFLLVATLSYTAIYQSNPRRNGQGIEAFLYKIKIAPLEAFKTKINKEDWKEFHDNYRSFENIITVKKMSTQPTSCLFIGLGLGSSLDLGQKIWTNDGEQIRHIPFLHNAFMTVFLKAGLMGILCLIVSMFILGKKVVSVHSKNIDPWNLLFFGSAIYLIVSNWVFMGLYLKLDNKSLLLGLLFGYRESIKLNPVLFAPNESKQASSHTR